MGKARGSAYRVQLLLAAATAAAVRDVHPRLSDASDVCRHGLLLGVDGLRSAALGFRGLRIAPQHPRWLERGVVAPFDHFIAGTIINLREASQDNSSSNKSWTYCLSPAEMEEQQPRRQQEQKEEKRLTGSMPSACLSPCLSLPSPMLWSPTCLPTCLLLASPRPCFP